MKKFFEGLWVIIFWIMVVLRLFVLINIIPIIIWIIIGLLLLHKQ